MQRALGQIHQNLESTLREQPRLREYLEKLEKERAGFKKQYEDTRLAVNALTKEHAAARNARDLNSRRAKIVGRISLWLESVQQDFEDLRLVKELETVRKRVEGLQSKLSGVEKEERLTSILNRIGIGMTELSNKMSLEHGRNPVRLDLRNVTVVVDRKDRPMPLQRLGSGENYVGYHLIAHFVMHQHFVSENRPVPRFLFIDQPTQVYYPKDLDPQFRGSINAVKDDDREKVRNMFNIILEVAKKLAPNFQVIVMDHADLQDQDFQNAVVARWRDGEALVPRDWIKG
jgi:predicted  nucleic acid-binding Zn-ribbon protein